MMNTITVVIWTGAEELICWFEGLTSVRPIFESHRDGDHEPDAMPKRQN
jgi:hypothetical protein